MGGWKHGKRGGHGAPAARCAVLLLAFGVLCGAVFLCGRVGVGHAEPGVGHARLAAHGTPGAPHAVCVAPYELPGCAPHSHVTPAVLPAPPPAVTVSQAGSAAVAELARTGPIRPPGTLARAPDLHVLQVLRT
ncbi:hypothetical protein ABT144_23255 [Streptomyces sp. NPDC002039]|uniref:hypothetical protein n=1 Tax=Streptomyces sp. NPDC002039 TaxID=3154660 RepID=UPI003320BB5E